MGWTFYNSSGQQLKSGQTAISNLDIDGATDIGAAIVDADLFIIDDGAGGTNRKTAASRIKTYIGTVPAQAVQSAIEGETDQDTYVPPDLLVHNPYVAKCFGVWDNAGTSIVGKNIASVADTGTGDFRVSIGTDMSAATYAPIAQATSAGTPAATMTNTDSRAAGTVDVKVWNAAGSAVDTEDRNILVIFGDR